MKRLLLSCFSIFLLGLATQAQVLTFDPDPVEKDFENVNLAIYNDLEVHVAVTNTTDDTIDLKWVREVPSICSNVWSSQICDNDLCYFDGVSSNYNPDIGLVDPFTLLPNETFPDFILHVKPGDQAGCCPYFVHFFRIDDWNDTLATLQFNVSVNTPDCDFTVGTEEEKRAAAAVNVFPNPTTGSFTLTHNEVVRQVAVFNILGKQVKTFNASHGQQYDIAEMPNGIYLVGMLNANGEVLRTVRLIKAGLRP